MCDILVKTAPLSKKVKRLLKILSDNLSKTVFQPHKTRSTVKVDTNKPAKGVHKMGNPHVPTDNTKTVVEHETPLKGTLASVLLLALFIIVVWGGVFALYVSRL